MARKSTGQAQSRIGNALVTLLASPVAAQADGKVSSFTGVAYSGDVVPNFSWYGDIAIDLASLSMPTGDVPVLMNHDPNKIVGRARLTNDGKSLTVTDGRFSAVTDCGKEVSALMGEGHPWMLSIGVNSKVQSQDRAKPVKLNGRSLVCDAVMRNGRLLEFSFVPSGADPNAYAAQLSARHGLQSPGDNTVDQDQIDQLNARITELTTQNATLTAQVATITVERDAARTELSAAATARRNERITALFGKEHGLADAELTEFRSMTDAQFSVLETRMTKEREAGSGGALFTQQATAGRDPNAGAPGAAKSVNAPAGFSVDPERSALHAKALEYQAKHPNTDYLAAVTAVTA